MEDRGQWGGVLGGHLMWILSIIQFFQTFVQLQRLRILEGIPVFHLVPVDGLLDR